MKQKLKKIYLQPEASRLLDRLFVSCHGSDNPSKLRLLLQSNKAINLADMFNFKQIAAIDIWQYAQQNNSYIIEADDIIIIFAGDIHIKGTLNWITNYKTMIKPNGKPFLHCLKEMNLDLQKPIDQAIFAALDILNIGKVLNYDKKFAALKLNDIIFANVAIPKDINLTENCTVTTHYGAIISVLDTSNDSLKKKIHSIQAKNKKYQIYLQYLKNRTIDFHNISSSADKKAIDLSARFHQNY